MKTLEQGTEIVVHDAHLCLKKKDDEYIRLFRLSDTSDNDDADFAAIRTESGRLFATPAKPEIADHFLILPSDFLIWAKSGPHHTNRVEGSEKYFLLTVRDGNPTVVTDRHSVWTIKDGVIYYAPDYDEYDLALSQKKMTGPIPVWNHSELCYRFKTGEWLQLTPEN